MEHTAVTFHNDKLYTSGRYDVFPSGAVMVYVYDDNDDKWQRTQVIYMPSTCSNDSRLSLGVADNKLYICNSTNHAIYIYSLKGVLLQEHKDRNASYLCAADSSGLLEAKRDTTTLNVLTKTGWKGNILPGLCKQLKGAVILNNKLYVACSTSTGGFGGTSYLQLYNID